MVLPVVRHESWASTGLKTARCCGNCGNWRLGQCRDLRIPQAMGVWYLVRLPHFCSHPLSRIIYRLQGTIGRVATALFLENLWSKPNWRLAAWCVCIIAHTDIHIYIYYYYCYCYYYFIIIITLLLLLLLLYIWSSQSHLWCISIHISTACTFIYIYIYLYTFHRCPFPMPLGFLVSPQASALRLRAFRCFRPLLREALRPHMRQFLNELERRGWCRKMW